MIDIIDKLGVYFFIWFLRIFTMGSEQVTKYEIWFCLVITYFLALP